MTRGLFSLFSSQLHREMALHCRQPRLLFHSALFFLMVTVFFPLTMPPNPNLLRDIAPGIIWIATLLSMLLSAAGLFQQDYEDGIIEQWLVSPYPLSLIIAAKYIIYWLVNLIPLLIFCPLLALIFGFSIHEMLFLMLGLILGTPGLVAICGFAAAFGAGIQQKGVVMALVLLPLTLPLMIFGAGAQVLVMQGLNPLAHLAILLAIAILALAFVPFATAVVIRISLAD